MQRLTLVALSTLAFAAIVFAGKNPIPIDDTYWYFEKGTGPRGGLDVLMTIRFKGVKTAKVPWQESATASFDSGGQFDVTFRDEDITGTWSRKNEKSGKLTLTPDAAGNRAIADEWHDIMEAGMFVVRSEDVWPNSWDLTVDKSKMKMAVKWDKARQRWNAAIKCKFKLHGTARLDDGETPVKISTKVSMKGYPD